MKSIKNSFISWVYRHVLKPVFFRIDPEVVHDRFTAIGKLLGFNALTRALTSLLFLYKNKKLTQTVAGIEFENPVGLAAGFDKNAELTDILPSVGFGFVEVGSITGKPCDGNPKPRLWRVPEKQSLRVWYGLKNDGCEAIATRLRGKAFCFPVGISVARTNDDTTVTREAGIADYVKVADTFRDIGDYITINTSCPNVCGGESFSSGEQLDELLVAVVALKLGKPLFLKLSPDLTDGQLDSVLSLVEKYRVDGVICTNLTKKDVDGNGGLSGKAVEELSNEMIRKVYKRTGGKLTIIGCGGIFTAEDAYIKIKAGASLLQMITGMIYQGPQVISEINRGLVDLLERDGYKSVGEAVGKGV